MGRRPKKRIVRKKNRRQKSEKNNFLVYNRFNSSLTIHIKSVVATALILGLGYFSVFKIVKLRYMRRAKELITKRRRVREKNTESISRFLINSGRQRLTIGNYEGAVSEFRQVLKISPENKEARSLLFHTLSLLCNKEKTYCEELDQLEFQ